MMSNQVGETLQDALGELVMAKRFHVHACHACACLSEDASEHDTEAECDRVSLVFALDAMRRL
jgi:hypothetical protein